MSYSVLFLCTGNSARSIMAEGLLNTLGHGSFRAYSAGSQPTGRVNPFAIEQLKAIGYRSDELRSKSWNEFSGDSAPQMDFIITVCGNAAGETCPVWPGHPVSAHWGFEDPAAVQGSDADKRVAFSTICNQIRGRIEQLLALPMEKLSREEQLLRLREIGQYHA